jgi:hypothetical protein
MRSILLTACLAPLLPFAMLIVALLSITPRDSRPMRF